MNGADGEERHPAERVLLGRDPRQSVRLLAVAGALFVVAFLVHLPPRLVGPFSVSLTLFLPSLVAASVVVAAVSAYVNDGLLVCIALAGGISYGFYFPLVIFDLAYPSETVLWALGVGGGFAVSLGSAGFLVGSLGRRAVDRVTA